MLTGLYILAAFWPLAYGFSFLKSHAALSLTWVVSCLTMSTFTMRSPAMQQEDRTLM